MICNFCLGPAHPATDRVYGPSTIACASCTALLLGLGHPPHERQGAQGQQDGADVLRVRGRPSEMTCAEHITKAEQLGYIAWHEKASRSKEKQVRCSECGLLYFSWERRKPIP